MLGRYTVSNRGRYGLGSLGIVEQPPEIGRAEFAELTDAEIEAGGFVVPMYSIYADPARQPEDDVMIPLKPSTESQEAPASVINVNSAGGAGGSEGVRNNFVSTDEFGSKWKKIALYAGLGLGGLLLVSVFTRRKTLADEIVDIIPGKLGKKAKKGLKDLLGMEKKARKKLRKARKRGRKVKKEFTKGYREIEAGVGEIRGGVGRIRKLKKSRGKRAS